MLTSLLERLTRRPPFKRKAEVFYGKVVAAARQPGFYGPGRAPDTPEGRFELIALHLFLIAERVKTTAPDGQDVARALIEAFVVDMDDCMREMGVGDLTVPKRVKRAAAGFYERSGAYRDGLAAGLSKPAEPDALASIAARTILQQAEGDGFARVLADYIRASQTRLDRLSSDELAAGRWDFAPAPAPLA